MNSLCRVCLKEYCKGKKGTRLVSLFKLDGQQDCPSDKIMKCTTVQVDKKDNLPSKICIDCQDKLNVAYDFKTQCEKSDRMLKIYHRYKPEGRGTEGTECLQNAILSVIKLNALKDEPPEVEEIYEQTEQEAADEDNVMAMIEDYHDNFDDEDFVPEVKKSNRVRRVSKKKNNGKTSARTKAALGRPPRLKMQKVKMEIVEVKVEDEEGLGGVGQEGEELLLEGDKQLAKKKRIKRTLGRPKTAPSLHICEQCGKSFKYRDSFKGHMMRHKGERTHMCTTCGMSFYSSSDLKKHMMKHTGVKPYKCQYCGRCFSDWGSRFKHERCHTGERPYKCDMCDKSFSYSYVLSRHKLIHSGKKEFSCEICDKNFTLKYHLSNHNKRNHPHLVKPKPLEAVPAEMMEEEQIPHVEATARFVLSYKRDFDTIESPDAINQQVLHIDETVASNVNLGYFSSEDEYRPKIIKKKRKLVKGLPINISEVSYDKVIVSTIRKEDHEVIIVMDKK